MISFDTGSHRFNLRAAAVIMQREYVLLHQVDGDDFWSLPGGRVEPGEPAARTIAREMQEEIGVTVRAGKMLCIAENFYAHGGRQHHEIGLYFAASLEAGAPLLDVTVAHRGAEGDKGLTFAWFSRHRLSEIDVQPAFLREWFDGDHAALAHVVQLDERYDIARCSLST
ncbi:NUDIX hydrolase [Burkholderia stagnalis]